MTERRQTLGTLRRELRAEADAGDAVHLQRFFKTGPGQYGEGDKFLGVRVPVLRRLARAYRDLSVAGALTLLQSKWHEERLLGLLLLVRHYQSGDSDRRQVVYDAYLAHTRHIDNWDLVDASAEHIVGPHVPPGSLDVLERLAASPDLWERRIAMLAMPRTALRYAIEHFPERDRKRYLARTI